MMMTHATANNHFDGNESTTNASLYNKSILESTASTSHSLHKLLLYRISVISNAHISSCACSVGKSIKSSHIPRMGIFKSSLCKRQSSKLTSVINVHPLRPLPTSVEDCQYLTQFRKIYRRPTVHVSSPHFSPSHCFAARLTTVAATRQLVPCVAPRRISKWSATPLERNYIATAHQTTRTGPSIKMGSGNRKFFWISTVTSSSPARIKRN